MYFFKECCPIRIIVLIRVTYLVGSCCSVLCELSKWNFNSNVVDGRTGYWFCAFLKVPRTCVKQIMKQISFMTVRDWD